MSQRDGKHDHFNRKTPINLKNVADSVIELSLPLSAPKDVDLVNRIPPSLPVINADEDRMYQILHNLVANAIKFTNEGSVTLDAVAEKDGVFVSVRDTGAGVPPNKLNSIFNSFEQADGSIARDYGGTGLGLSITKQLIELHGGEIWVESEVGKGSCFYFTMPEILAEIAPDSLNRNDSSTQKVSGIPNSYLANPFASHPTNATTSSMIMETTSAPISKNQTTIDSHAKTTPYRLLVVDDEPINIEVLKNHLNIDKYSLTCIFSGKEALDLIKKGAEFDLVLLDIMMPGISGYDVCTELRQRYSEEQLPILMLTAMNKLEDLVKGFKCGANDYLTKPFIKDELLARIDLNLKLKEAVQQVENKVRERTLALEIANEHLKQAKLIAEEARNELSEFSTMIGHELRTPISILQCEIELLVDGVRTPNEETLNSLLDEVLHLGGLTNDIFELILSDAKSLKYEKERLELNRLIHDSIDLLASQFEKNGIALSTNYSNTEDCLVFADPKRIRQVLQNILKNSIKYTDSNGQASIHTEVQDKQVLIHFQDSSPGVTQDDLNQLFDRFYRVEKSRSRATGGTGLGLSICKAIMTDHDGDIEAQNSPLGGLWLTIILPLYQGNNH